MNVNFKRIISRAPLRLGLAGGGTDIMKFSNKYGGCVVNVTIGKYVYTLLEKTKKNIIFESIDKKIKIELKKYNSKINSKFSNELMLMIETYNFVVKKYNNGVNFAVKIKTFSEIPEGSGLGGSSTLVVSCLNALLAYLKIKISKKKLAKLAVYIEREVCKIPGGQQDQYAAAYGGLNYFSFNPNLSVNRQKIITNERLLSIIESRLLLFYVSRRKKSSDIIKSQEKNILIEKKSLDAFFKLKREAKKIKNSFLNSNYTQVIKIMNKSWKSKKKTSKLIAENKNLKLIMKIQKLGAEMVKLSGAGGGGFLFILTKIDNKKKIIDYLKKVGNVLIENIKLDKEGAKFWYE